MALPDVWICNIVGSGIQWVSNVDQSSVIWNIECTRVTPHGPGLSPWNLVRLVKIISRLVAG